MYEPLNDGIYNLLTSLRNKKKTEGMKIVVASLGKFKSSVYMPEHHEQFLSPVH